MKNFLISKNEYIAYFPTGEHGYRVFSLIEDNQNCAIPF